MFREDQTALVALCLIVTDSASRNPQPRCTIRSPGSPETNFNTVVGDSTRQALRTRLRPSRHMESGRRCNCLGNVAISRLPPDAQDQRSRPKNVANGIHWLMVHQKPDGDLAAGGTPRWSRMPWQPSRCARPMR